MQINNISLNNQNFGMSLKIKNNARTALEHSSMATIDSLKKVGKELEDTQYYDMFLSDNMKVSIVPKKQEAVHKTFSGFFIDYIKTLTNENVKKDMQFKNFIISKFSEFVGHGSALSFYREIKGLPYLEAVGRFVKRMDEKEIHGAMLRELEAKRQKEELKLAVNELMNTFGVK